MLQEPAEQAEAPQEGLQRNLSVATGRKQLQNAMRTHLVWVSFRQAALAGKNAHREQPELRSTVWAGQTEGTAAQSTALHSDGSRSQGWNHTVPSASPGSSHRGCEQPAPTITQLSMTHQGTQGWFPTNNPGSTANPPLNHISNSNPAQTCRF